MARLSMAIENLKERYTVVVIGSGYGAAIAASRMARAGQQVCVLERGKEFQPGEYPDTELRAIEEMQANLPDGQLGPRTGLYEMNVNEDINVFKGCGLGGTSLVNANVALRAEPRVFLDPRWPKALRDDLGAGLQAGYEYAEEMLKPVTYPESGFPNLPKLEAHKLSARTMGVPFMRTPINVNFALSGKNHVGVEQNPCSCCGDCVTGCNYAAKNTLIMNYLPDARNHGAEIYTQVDVKWIEQSGKRWLVHVEVLGVGREKFSAPELTVGADVLILGAGSLGSTEILLRSKAKNLTASDQVGLHFTGNGDVLSFAYDTDHVINGVGWGHHRPGEIPPAGPCITSVIDIRQQPVLEDGMIIEEGSPPGPIAGFLPGTLAVAADLIGRESRTGLADEIREGARRLATWVEGPYHGAINNTQTYLVMTHDDGAGRMTLEDDRLRIHWPGVGTQTIFEKVNARLEQASNALGGTFVHNPLWSKVLHKNLITVHPLGGCVMAEDAEHGVVNHKGQVFSSTKGSPVYEGLYVLDGAIIPRPLGVNPLLTISALAERAVALAAQDRGWQIKYDLPSAPPAPPEVQKVGIEFTETMSGHFSSSVKDDYQRGAKQGEQENSPFTFTLTIVSEDVEATISDPEHQARMLGTVIAPALSPRPLTVNEGKFSLFVVDPTEPATRRMWYKMPLTADNGRVYFFEGFKLIRDRPLTDVWADTTTLYITLFDGADGNAPVLGKGILIIRPQDFLRQLSTMRAINTSSLKQKLEAEGKFARFFLGVLAQKYGRIFRAPGNP